jgi:hypothetical protein
MLTAMILHSTSRPTRASALVLALVFTACGNEDAATDASEAGDDDAAPTATEPSPSASAPEADDDVPEPVLPASDDDVPEPVAPAGDDDVPEPAVPAVDDDVADDDVPADDDMPADDDTDAGMPSDDVMEAGAPPDDDGLGPCQVPDGATILADYQLFNPDGGPAYGLVADGTTVYVGFVDRIVAIPQAGGAPSEVYQSDYGVSLYDYGAYDAFLVRSGTDWFDLQASAVTPAAFPAADFPGLSVVFAAKDRDTVWLRADDLYYRIATYAMLVRDAAEPTDVVPEVVEGTGGPLLVTPGLDSALVQKAPLDNTDPEFDAFTLVSESGEFTVAAVTEGGEPFLLTDNYVYYNRASTAPEAEQGVWRAAVAADGFESPVSLEALPAVLGVVDDGQVAIHAASALYTVSDVDSGATLAELAALDTRNDPGDACASHGLALAEGEVITTLFHQASNQTIVFKLPLP